MSDARTVRDRLLCEHRDTIAGVLDAAGAVAAATEWPVTEPSVLRQPLDACLRERGLTDPLLGVLETGGDVLGTRVRGAPVAAPPYLAVTSRGPVCRATLADGRRLVVVVVVFAVERRPRRYRFLDPGPESCLTVSLE